MSELKPLPIFDVTDAKAYAEYMAAKSLLAHYGQVAVFEKDYQSQMDNEHFPVGTVIADYKRQIRDLETMLAATQESARAWQNDNHELHRRLEDSEEKRNKLMEIVLECRVSVLIPGEMIEYMDEVWIPAKKHEQVVNKLSAELDALTDTRHGG